MVIASGYHFKSARPGAGYSGAHLFALAVRQRLAGGDHVFGVINRPSNVAAFFQGTTKSVSA